MELIENGPAISGPIIQNYLIVIAKFLRKVAATSTAASNTATSSNSEATIVFATVVSEFVKRNTAVSVPFSKASKTVSVPDMVLSNSATVPLPNTTR